MNQFPKISIITPSYNQGHFIEETILSIVNQNYPNLEYIIIDGGSTDNTVDIIKKYQNHIHFWVSEPDKGQTHAINKGFKMATGDIIGWVNSDDLLVEEGLYNIINGFNKFRSADFIHGKRIVKTQNQEIKIYDAENFRNLELEYLGSFPFLQPACFFKRNILNEIGYLDESFYSTMDLDLFLRIALNYNMQYIDFPVAIFREQVDAKTFIYNDVWDYERTRVLNKLMRSLNADKEIIYLLKKFDLFIYGIDKYPISKKIPKEDLLKILALFVRDSINLNFNANRFKEAYKLSKLMKANLPDFFTDKLAFYHNRAKYYQHNFIYLFTRPLGALKNRFKT